MSRRLKVQLLLWTGLFVVAKVEFALKLGNFFPLQVMYEQGLNVYFHPQKLPIFSIIAGVYLLFAQMAGWLNYLFEVILFVM